MKSNTPLLPLSISFLSIITSSITICYSKSLSELSHFLRSDDYRLIRPSPEETTSIRQNSDACRTGLQDAFIALTRDDFSLQEKTAAANVVTLCTTNHPINRAKIAKFGKKAHDALVSMVSSSVDDNDDDENTTTTTTTNRPKKENWQAAAAASEAIWISSFNSPENHSLFLQSHVLDALISLVLAPSCNDSTTISICHHAQMWGAAALQNMAASYCDSESGHCWWEYNYEEDRLELDPESPLTVDSERVRRYLLKNKRLLSRLVTLTCAGPVKRRHERGVYPWPSRAEIATTNDDDDDDDDRRGDWDSDESFATIVPWAAAGALRNLAISKEARDVIIGSGEDGSSGGSDDDDDVEFVGSAVFDCFCNLANSPDWLERIKAEDAIYRLGYGVDDDCPLSYDENCQDMEGWEDEDGENCTSYETNYWCIEYGDIENEDGVKVKDACCACGGGYINSTEEL